MQDGWKEHLLCRDCEGRIGKWEKIVSEELRGKRRAMAAWRIVHDESPIWLPPMAQRPPLEMLEAVDCDYRAWRLFLLSLLWKMAKAKHDAFKPVRLSEEDTATIQGMLVRGEPGEPMDYPCWMYILALEGKPMKAFVSAPHETRFERHVAFELAFGGLGWLYIVGKAVKSETMRWFVLDRNGTMRLWRRDARGVRWFMDGLQRMETLQE